MTKLNVVIYQEGDQFVSQCLNVDVASCGDTYEEAKKNLHEAVELYFEDNDNPHYIPIGAITITEDYLGA